MKFWAYRLSLGLLAVIIAGDLVVHALILREVYRAAWPEPANEYDLRSAMSEVYAR